MSLEPRLVAQRAIDALPEALSKRAIVQGIALRLADEVLRYGDGTLPFQRRGEQGDGVVELICEDLEASLLLQDLLATQEEEADELTPEEKMALVLDKAEKVKAQLDGGESLQNLIRVELADTDCGACDHPTCDLYSIALANGKDPDNNKCEPGGPKVTAQVELVMSVGRGEQVNAEKILGIESQAKDEPKREGGLRALEISTGRGFPAVVFSQLFPDVDFEVIESDLKRVWFLKRLMNMMSIRNCRIRVGRPEDFVDQLAGHFDAVFIKHTHITQAVMEGLSFVRPGGTLVNWQDKNWSVVGSEYQHSGPGMRMPLRAPAFFKSDPISQSVLLMTVRPDEPSETPVDPAPESTDAPEATDDSVAV